MIVAHVQTPLVFVQPLAAISDASVANVVKQAVAPQKAVPQVKKIEMEAVDRVRAGKDPLAVSQYLQGRLNVSSQPKEGNGALPSGVGLPSVSASQPSPSPRGDLIGALLTSFSS
jgi:hypothetical protein